MNPFPKLGSLPNSGQIPSSIENQGAPKHRRIFFFLTTQDLGFIMCIAREARGRIKNCADYPSGQFCCGCGGGIVIRNWAVECDLCRPVSIGRCDCKEGPWTLFGEKSRAMTKEANGLRSFQVWTLIWMNLGTFSLVSHRFVAGTFV